MKDDGLYLRPNIQVEPLVDQWYAWPQLIPPTTAARNITERHLKIMDSYIAAPQFHAQAVRNPRMIGGPFMDYGGDRTEDVRALRDWTRERRAPLIALSAALGELHALLSASAKGFSLHALYERVPEPLKGYVELVYSMSNHPWFRLLEPLLYRRYYDNSTQSLLLSVTDGDDRPFALSTPRLLDGPQVHVRVPFDDERVDALFRLKTRPAPWSRIRSLFDVADKDETTFRSFFTDAAPPSYPAYDGDGLRWRYFGHACILIETGGTSVLFDPVLSYTYENGISRYTYADLPDTIDYVVITHNHIDHLLFETLLQIRHKVRHVVVPRNTPGSLIDPSMALLLEHAGFGNVIELRELETVGDDRLSITGLPFFGEHGDLDIATKLAYMVRARGSSLMFAADSCNIEPRVYTHLHREFGDMRALFIGMECTGAPLSFHYGPLMLEKIDRAMDESRRLNGSNYEQAKAIVDEFRCRDVYVYAMGQEPWLVYVSSIKYTEQSRPIVDSNRLIAECQARGITCERLFGEKEILLDLREAAAAT